MITTDRLLALYQQGQSSGLLVLHVLGQGPSLPMAQNAVAAAQTGDFQDQTRQQFGHYLQQVTQGNKNVPIVLYCQSTQCRMSYNAALRAIQMGYAQVYWYRGGIEAWQHVQQAASATMRQDPSGYQNAGYRPTAQPGCWKCADCPLNVDRAEVRSIDPVGMPRSPFPILNSRGESLSAATWVGNRVWPQSGRRGHALHAR